MTSSVKVAVRSRPLGGNELRDGCQSCVVFPGYDKIIIGGRKEFKFDYVFSDQSTQQDIYEGAVKDIICNLFIGYNVTVLAYGQTGSGKTYTMGTNNASSSINSHSGIIPRTIYDIYRNFDTMRETSQITVKVYKEEIFDLLSSPKEVRTIREENHDVKMPGLIEANANTIDDIFKCLLKGSENRTVGSTNMNEASSRSHAIFTIYITIVPLNNGGDPISSKLHLVDLAGSERAGKTGATGDRLKEGTDINRGLLSLSMVIGALVDRERKRDVRIHVPYRDSKLTRLLQDSLGGNAKTLLMACISPADTNFYETSSTLKYAAKAAQIVNTAVINTVSSDQGEIFQLRAQVTALKAQLRDAGFGAGPAQVAAAPSLLHTNEMYELNTKVVAMQRERLQMLEECEEEVSKRDDLLRKLWDKMSAYDGADKDDVYDELERFIQDITGKDESEDQDEQERLSEDTENTMKVTQTLRCLREELACNEQKLANTVKDALTQQQENPQQYEEKYREYEQRIRELENELNSRKNHHGRQEEIETQLKETRRQLNELHALKKEKDRRTVEMNQLKQKIQELKTSIVKVTKDLNKEKASFKKISADQEKQYKILVHKDRLLQSQMERQATQHAKETAVLKRKLQSGTANEKRLKELLENRKNFTVNRITRNNANTNINSQVKLWIKQSLKQAAMVCETRQIIEGMIEKRRKLTEELEQGTDVDEIETEIRRINDLISQQQANITDPNYETQAAANWNQLRNITECRITIKFMFRQLVNERVHNVMIGSEMQDLKTQMAALEEANTALSMEMEKTRPIYEERMNMALKKRRTTMAFSDILGANSHEPRAKKKKYHDSDTDSIADSTNSRRSSRLSEICRCKTGCKKGRCGCLKFGSNCTARCSCKGRCSEGFNQLVEIEEMVAEDLSDKENDCNRTFVNVDRSLADDNDVANTTFVNIEDTQFIRKADKSIYFPSLCTSNRID